MLQRFQNRFRCCLTKCSYINLLFFPRRKTRHTMQSYGFSSQWVKSGNSVHMSQWDFRFLQNVQQGHCSASSGQASVADTAWLFLGWLMKQTTSWLGYPEPLLCYALDGIVPLKGLSQQCFPLKHSNYIFSWVFTIWLSQHKASAKP